MTPEQIMLLQQAREHAEHAYDLTWGDNPNIEQIKTALAIVLNAMEDFDGEQQGGES